MPPNLVDPVYATDEDVAVAATGDFVVLAPSWQTLGAGTDGVFAPDEPWALTSATVDFEASGVSEGCVVLLTRPTTAFKGSGHLLAVDSVAGGTVVLRRVGIPSGKGQPPAPAAGLTGVEFRIPSLYPQIESASYGLNQRFAIGRVPNRTADALADPRDLRSACIASVLQHRYAAEMRSDNKDFARKAALHGNGLTEILARLTLRFETEPGRPVVFAARLER